MEQELNELQHNVNIINTHGNTQLQTEYTQAIDFLENEIVKYREFVEKQQDFLIWLVGIIGTGLLGLFTFFEIKGRKDISGIIQSQYANQVRQEIGSFIGGQDRMIYLKNCVEKEEQAKNREITFLCQDKLNMNLLEVYKILEEQRYCVKKKKIKNITTDKEISQIVEKSDIVVYQVDESEFKTEEYKPSDNVVYARIAKECNKQKIYGILYCENNRALERSLYDSYFYLNSANYGLTVMERIFHLLYFV